MDTEQIFKLLMEIGPNSSDAFICWIGLEVFKDITSVIGWLMMLLVIYKILFPLFGSLLDNRLLRIRSITYPDVEGPVSELEMDQVTSRIRLWKEKAEQWDKYKEQENEIKKESTFL